MSAKYYCCIGASFIGGESYIFFKEGHLHLGLVYLLHVGRQVDWFQFSLRQT